MCGIFSLLLIPGTGRIQLPEQSVHDRTLRFLIEAFHVDHATVAGRHQYRNSPVTGADRTTAFMSSESHSSTTMSSPSRNVLTVSTESPASNTSTVKYGSSSAILRAAA